MRYDKSTNKWKRKKKRKEIDLQIIREKGISHLRSREEGSRAKAIFENKIAAQNVAFVKGGRIESIERRKESEFSNRHEFRKGLRKKTKNVETERSKNPWS